MKSYLIDIFITNNRRPIPPAPQINPRNTGDTDSIDFVFEDPDAVSKPNTSKNKKATGGGNRRQNAAGGM
jgi:hypothetical protein